MNESLIYELVELFNFINDPLWDLYNASYNPYEGSPIVGVIILGLMASIYPSQMATNFSSMMFITNEMIDHKKWWQMVFGIFVGKLIMVYTIVIMLLSDYQWSLHYKFIGALSIPLVLVLGITFFLDAVRNGDVHSSLLNKFKLEKFPLLKGCLIGLIISLFIEINVIGIIRMFIPFLNANSFAFSIILPFVFAFVAFMPVWIFSLLGYGFNFDVLIREKISKKKAHLFFGISLTLIALNIFLLYQ